MLFAFKISHSCHLYTWGKFEENSRQAAFLANLLYKNAPGKRRTEALACTVMSTQSKYYNIFKHSTKNEHLWKEKT